LQQAQLLFTFLALLFRALRPISFVTITAHSRRQCWIPDRWNLIFLNALGETIGL
jgi:hypothetical protein